MGRLVGCWVWKHSWSCFTTKTTTNANKETKILVFHPYFDDISFMLGYLPHNLHYSFRIQCISRCSSQDKFYITSIRMRVYRPWNENYSKIE